MKPILTSLAIAAALVVPTVLAAAAEIDPVFGNTIVSTYPSGRSTRLWLERDGTYEAQRTNGKRTAGKWSIKGDKVCLKQTRPTALPLTFCSRAPSGGAGTRWAAKSPKNEPLSNELVAGQGGR